VAVALIEAPNAGRHRVEARLGDLGAFAELGGAQRMATLEVPAFDADGCHDATWYDDQTEPNPVPFGQRLRADLGVAAALHQLGDGAAHRDRGERLSHLHRLDSRRALPAFARA